jgi:hypothetical protein
MKYLLTIGFALTLLFTEGCSTTQQTATANTIASLQATTKAAYDAYIICVARGDCSTNGVPQVAAQYNKFQGGALVAISIAQNSTNSFAPSALSDQAATVLNLISQFKK